MSSEKVKKFLEEKKTSVNQTKEQDLAQQRFKVLSHYDLGEIAYYKEGDAIEDFPLIYN